MSLTLHQPNLLSSSHPCGQSWHNSSNVDISLLLKPRDDNEIAIPIIPAPRAQSQDQDSLSSPSQSQPRSISRARSTSGPDQPPSIPATAPATIQHQQQQQKEQQQQQQQQPPPPAPATRTTTSLVPAKRPASSLNPPTTTISGISRHAGAQPSPAKKQSKWSPYEDSKIISLRAEGMKWEDISRHLPGRSAISCRLHYQNYLERRSEWDEDRKDRLARLYERFKQEMWSKIAEEMAIPWRAAEAMHWQIGEHDMARRAGVTPFSLTTASPTSTSSHNGASGGNASRPGHNNHSRLSASRLAGGEKLESSSPYSRVGAQQLPSLAELTAGLPAFTHPAQPLLPGPGSVYMYSDTRTPGTPYSSGLPYPGQMITPSPGDTRSGDYFLKRP